MIYKYVYYSLLINYLFIDVLSIEINNFLFLFRFYCFFLINLLFTINLLIINNIKLYPMEFNINILNNYIISNGVYFIDYILIGNSYNINLGELYDYYNIPILIFKLIIIYNLINLKKIDIHPIENKDIFLYDDELNISS